MADEKSNLNFTNTQGYIDVSEKREVWKEIAKQYNGDFKISKTRDSVIEILRMQIKHNNYVINISESDTRPLKFEIEIKLQKEFNFTITPEDYLEKVYKFFGRQDVIIRNKILDDKYLIQSDKPDLLISVITDKDIQSRLIKCNINSIVFTFDKKKEVNTLFTMVNRTTNDVNSFKHLVDLHIMLVDTILEKCK